MKLKKVVIMHAMRQADRITNAHYLRAFLRYSPPMKLIYSNIFGDLNDDLLNADLVIVSYELVSLRNAPFWSNLVERMRPILNSADKRILIPQDDYTSCCALDSFAVEFKFDAIYSGIREDIDLLYPQSIREKIRFEYAFAGYAPDANDETFRALRTSLSVRPIDLGQRIRWLPPQFGVLGSRKAEITEYLAACARLNSFNVDVLTADSDVFVGEKWFSFLASSRFTTGRLGGASLADPLSKNADRVRRYLMRHQDKKVKDLTWLVKQKWSFGGNFSAISPRIFEAAALGTCQILERDNYFTNFEPWVHYVPLESDFSNIKEIMEAMTDLDKAQLIADNCFARVIASEDFSYKTFITDFYKRELSLSSSGQSAQLVDSDLFLDPGREVSGELMDEVQKVVRKLVVRGKTTKTIRVVDFKRYWGQTKSEKFRKSENLEVGLNLTTKWLKSWEEKVLIPESLMFNWSGITRNL